MSKVRLTIEYIQSFISVMDSWSNLETGYSKSWNNHQLMGSFRVLFTFQTFHKYEACKTYGSTLLNNVYLQIYIYYIGCWGMSAIILFMNIRSGLGKSSNNKSYLMFFDGMGIRISRSVERLHVAGYSIIIWFLRCVYPSEIFVHLSCFLFLLSTRIFNSCIHFQYFSQRVIQYISKTN